MTSADRHAGRFGPRLPVFALAGSGSPDVARMRSSTPEAVFAVNPGHRRRTSANALSRPNAPDIAWISVTSANVIENIFNL
jgi:hypothetical protein